MRVALTRRSAAASRMTEADDNHRLFLTEPCIAELMGAKVNLFELNELVNMATTAGLHCEIQICNPA